MISEPYHDGEIALQVRTGERDRAHRHGAGISSEIIPAALAFLARQRLVALSATGTDGHLWTSVWCGQPGFIRSADGRRVSILFAEMAMSPDDPVYPRLRVGSDVGMLAIEFASRRRLRINGTVERRSTSEVVVVVRESVPNCPKYIQRRHPDGTSLMAPGRRPTQWGRTLDDARRALIERMDTAFVGSLHQDRGVDASHRGGAPGFLHVVDATTVRVPDYAGNSMFMTLGNFEIDSRASLAVLDFDLGAVASFSGSARRRFDVERPEQPSGGTGRYWDFSVRDWVHFELPSFPRWELLDASPFNPAAPQLIRS